MNYRSVLSAVLFSTTFACLPMTVMTAQAADDSEKTVTGQEAHNRELKIGDKAPDQYKRDDLVVSDWEAKKLPKPEKESHWVRMGEQYVLVQITNGVILDIKP